MRWVPIIVQNNEIKTKLPFHGQEILITVSRWDDEKHRHIVGVTSDVFLYRDLHEGYCTARYHLKSGIPFDNVLAWMPLPEPYSCSESSTEYIYRTTNRLMYDDMALGQTERVFFMNRKKEWDD